MAEPIGLASGLLTLAVFAFQSSVTLSNTVKSFQSHQQRIRELSEELGALSEVLSSLNETVNAMSDVDFSTLKRPLLQCGTACKDFEKELFKCLSHSSGGRTSFRDWAKLRYMGEDIDGFRRMLAGYKLTITVALADANLRKSSITAENIEGYSDLLNTARADLEDRLERIDEKLDLMLGKNLGESESDASEIKLIKDERLSTEKCLQICAQLSDHIEQIQIAARSSVRSGESISSDTLPERITCEGLQECKNDLIRTAQKLEAYQKQLVDRLIDKSRTATASEEDIADLTRLRDEWEATRQGMDICAAAHDHLRENVSTIDNYATGDALQFMVSTNNKTIHGRNRGFGWRTRQVGGHLSDESVQQIAKALGSTASPIFGHTNVPPHHDSLVVAEGVAESEARSTKFKEQYGTGFKLPAKSNSNAPLSPAIPAEGRRSTPPK